MIVKFETNTGHRVVVPLSSIAALWWISTDSAVVYLAHLPEVDIRVNGTTAARIERAMEVLDV